MTGSTVTIHIGQSYNVGIPEELKYFCTIYGGKIRKAKEATDTQRTQWALNFCGEHCRPLLEAVATYGILKAPQAITALQYLDGDKQDAELFRCSLQEQKLKYNTISIDKEKLSKDHLPPYLAGLFASDGSCCIDNTGGIAANITQPKSVALLEVIKDQLEKYELIVGSTTNIVIQFFAENAFKFLQLIQLHVIGQKVKQIELILQHYQEQQIRKKIEKRWIRTDEEIAEHQHRIEKVKKLKKL